MSMDPVIVHRSLPLKQQLLNKFHVHRHVLSTVTAT